MNNIDSVRKNHSLVHCLTNQVVMNFTANGLLAIGASPVMTASVHEASDMVAQAQALLINMGTPTEEQVEAMLRAGKRANECGIPVVFDPVGVGATEYRKKVAESILTNINITVIRGNGGEIATLAGSTANVRGVDGSTSAHPKQVADRVAQKYNTIVAMTGPEDVVSDGTRTAIIRNGHPFMNQVVGTGCLLGAVVAAFVGNTKDYFESTKNALVTYAVAGEFAHAEAGHRGIGSFQVAFLNQLHRIADEDVKRNQCVKI